MAEQLLPISSEQFQHLHPILDLAPIGVKIGDRIGDRFSSREEMRRWVLNNQLEIWKGTDQHLIRLDRGPFGDEILSVYSDYDQFVDFTFCCLEPYSSMSAICGRDTYTREDLDFPSGFFRDSFDGINLELIADRIEWGALYRKDRDPITHFDPFETPMESVRSDLLDDEKVFLVSEPISTQRTASIAERDDRDGLVVASYSDVGEDLHRARYTDSEGPDIDLSVDPSGNVVIKDYTDQKLARFLEAFDIAGEMRDRILRGCL